MSVGQNFDDEESKEAIGYLVSVIKSWRKIAAFVLDNAYIILAFTIIIIYIGALRGDNLHLAKTHNELLPVAGPQRIGTQTQTYGFFCSTRNTKSWKIAKNK